MTCQLRACEMAVNLNKKVLRACRKEILETLNDPEEVIEHLLSENVLNRRQYQILKAENIQLDQVAKLLDFIELAADFGFNSFLTALETEYIWLKKAIESKRKTFNDSLIVDAAMADQEPLTEQQLLGVSRQLLMGDWELLGFELGLTHTDLQRCKCANDLPVLQSQEMLVSWKRKQGGKATKQKLENALHECDLHNIIVP